MNIFFENFKSFCTSFQKFEDEKCSQNGPKYFDSLWPWKPDKISQIMFCSRVQLYCERRLLVVVCHRTQLNYYECKTNTNMFFSRNTIPWLHATTCWRGFATWRVKTSHCKSLPSEVGGHRPRSSRDLIYHMTSINHVIKGSRNLINGSS